MKALIFNSGTGSRMGRLTEHCPKCLLKPIGEESIFARQIRILSECGITEIIVTTGKYERELMEEGNRYPWLNITYVNNPQHEITNYIYSMYLTGKYIDDDLLLLHGDLVFDKELVKDILADRRTSLCVINKHAKQPKKDFKGRIVNDCLKEVAIDIFDEDCYALQPLYKLSVECAQSWIEEVNRFVERGITNVYAENALNAIADDLHIGWMSYENYYIAEVDTPEDYECVSKQIHVREKQKACNREEKALYEFIETK